MENFFTAGLQHIGIPTNDMEATIDFYGRLGFNIDFETTLKEENAAACRVCFFKLGSLCIEAYENHQAAMKTGAIAHISMDTSDVEAAFKSAGDGGFKLLDSAVRSLPFWKNGVKFFNIEGPNKEIIEFCQIL